MEKITKIVLTGGPCAGKSTAMELIKKKLLHLGYNVIIRPEGPTVLMENGFHPAQMETQSFQVPNIKYQLAMEEIFTECAQNIDKPSILLCDRGPLDTKAYVTPKEFKETTKNLNTTEEELKNRYDLVIFLNTMASLGEEYYGKNNNEHRRESYSEALDANQRTLNAWIGHPKLRIIKNEEEFKNNINAKIDKIMQEITGHLGRPTPIEIERKFLIKKPSLESLREQTNIVESDIQQIYLKSDPAKETRLRKQTIAGHSTYYYTQKSHHDPSSRFEIEQKITKQEFEYLKTFKDPIRAEINKKRFYFIDNGQYFELDIYPFFKSHAILELELADKNAAIQLPNFLEVISDVTDEKAYKNSEIAKTLQLAKKQKTALGISELVL